MPAKAARTWGFRDLCRWAWWNVWYALRKRPKCLTDFLTRGWRTRAPWAVFKPSIWHNDGMSEWQIFWEDERCFSENCSLPVSIYRELETGRIVGINVFDEVCREPDRYKQPYPYDVFKAACEESHARKVAEKLAEQEARKEPA